MEDYIHPKIFASVLFKQIFLISLFFFLTPVALIASIIALVSIQNTAKNPPMAPTSSFQNTGVYVTSEKKNLKVGSQVISKDSRVYMLKNFFDSYNSPLERYAQTIVNEADKNNIDWRLIPAIALKESGGCRVIPDESYNCWGWGIHSKGTLRFGSFEEGIETVTKGIKEKYIDLGYVTVEEIMSKWIPHSPEGAWAKDVNFYIEQIQ